MHASTRSRRALPGIAFLAALCIAAGGLHAAGEKRARSTPRPAPPVAGDSLAREPVVVPGETPDLAEPQAAGESESELHRKTVAYDMVKLGENVHVHPDEVVRGDIVLLGGDLRVEGEIVGGAVVVGGNIQVGPGARIGGEAVAVGGRVDAASGSEVRGGVVSLSFLPAPFFKGVDWARAQQVTSLVADVFKLGFVVLAALLFLIFVPERLRRARDVLDTAFLRCFGLGILALTGGLFAVVVAVVLLAITLIGIPVALLVAFLTVLLLVASLLVGAQLVGDRMRAALRLGSRPRLLSVLLGLFVLFLPEILADVLRLAWTLTPAGLALQLMHGALVLAALAAGLGALVLSRLGAQRAPSPWTPGLHVPAPGYGSPGGTTAAPWTTDQPFHDPEPPRASS